MYLRETFSRLVFQNSVMAFYPQNINDPTALCFNTGLLARSVVQIYCVIVPAVASSSSSNKASQAPWMVTDFVDEPTLYDPARWSQFEDDCRSKQHPLHANVLEPTRLPRKAIFFDTEAALIAGVFDELVPIFEELVPREEKKGLSFMKYLDRFRSTRSWPQTTKARTAAES